MQDDESEPNLFTRSTLAFSFRLLREDYPSLALEIQNYMMEAKLDNCQLESRQLDNIDTDYNEALSDADNYDIELNLDVAEVSQIVNAISEIAERAARNEFHSKKSLISIHATLLNWLLYAQSFTQDLQTITLDPKLKSSPKPNNS